MKREHRVKIVQTVVFMLTVVAFAGSYRHGVTWVKGHWTVGEDPGVWSWVTAALPEVMVIVAVLRYPDDSRDPRVWLTGGTAVAWTLWANGASAGPGLSGLVVAMWPAWAALVALTLAGHGVPPVEEPQVTHEVADPEKLARDTARRKRARVTRAIREKDAFVEEVDRATVCDRDNWTCHICGGPVDHTVDGNNPLGPSLDHVIPLSAGGAHSYDNVRLAHRKCNTVKGGVRVRDPAGTAMARGMAWAMAQPELPSRATIQATIGCSPKTASRIRGAVREAREGEAN